MWRQLVYMSILFAAAIAARAQSASFPPPTPGGTVLPPVFDFAPASDAVGTISQFAKKKIMVVTGTNKVKRTSCLVDTVTAGELVCAEGHFHSRRRIRIADIDALIQPAQRYRTWLLFTGWFGTGAGLITGACFLASVTVIGAVPVALLGGILLFSSPLAAMASDGDQPERLLYVRSGFSTSRLKLQ